MSSVYPFSVQAPFDSGGVYVGVDLLAGGAGFWWDPFEAYRAGAVTNPNCWVLGEPGNGKSALVKCLLWRMAARYIGHEARWIAIADPKGEYVPLAERLGLTVVRLTPGGSTRINPLADGPAADHEAADKQALRRAGMLCALVATVLDRPLAQLEDVALFTAVETLAGACGVAEATLRDVAALLADPPASMQTRLRSSGDNLMHDLAPITFALDKLLSRSLRGMFDGPSTVPLRWDGPGLLLDLSAVPIDSEAMPLVMTAAAGWLQQLMACPGPQRLQVLDEAWALLGNRHTTAYLQSSFKLGRTYGTANICITHRASDLGAQADDGTATAKIAAGLLADAATKIILRQAPDQLEAASTAFGLTPPQSQVLSHLTRGRALWKIGPHTTLVHHQIGMDEESLCDTDLRMKPSGAEAVQSVADS